MVISFNHKDNLTQTLLKSNNVILQIHWQRWWNCCCKRRVRRRRCSFRLWRSWTRPLW